MTATLSKTVTPARKSKSKWVHPHVISAIFQRDFTRFFYNPAGYVFIALFVLACAVMTFWQPVFFTRNLANLDTLNDAMPYLLLFFIPAITMSVWADERKQGTEELLLTLPATDFDVVVGKFLASVGIYTVSLIFTLPLIIQLKYLGNPDLGVTFTTYFGYWLTGCMMIAIGLVASVLSSNVTVAFILGAAFSAIPVFAALLSSPSGSSLRKQVEDLSIPAQARDFGTGVIPLTGLFYFLSATAALLYINMILLGRRNWAGGEKSTGRWSHSGLRVISLILALASLNVLVDRAGLRADASQERLHTLSAGSIALIKQIPTDRPVYIQAYFSPEVPREYVQTKTDLIGLLKEFAALAGDRIRLNLVETELYSNDARDAEKRFGIEPKRVMVLDEGKQTAEEILLGVAFSSGLEEVVIPFFDKGLPVEYELTRSIRVVSRTSRKKVGILSTDAKLNGSFDMRTGGQSPDWSIVTELKKQYDVSSVSPDMDIAADLDVLLVAQPSSLTQPQIDNLLKYVKAGGPTLLFVDPAPIVDLSLSPEAPKGPQNNPFGGGQPPEQKGDLKPLLDLLGIDWPTTDIVWNPYNPLQQRPDLAPEVVFLGKGSGADDAFNSEEIVTSGLQEIVGIFPGLLRDLGTSGVKFTPLLRTNDSGGTISWNEAIRQDRLGGTKRHIATGIAYTLAAHIQADAPAKPETESKEKKEAEKPAKAVHAIVIADLDMISEEFFELRRQKVDNLDLDNVTFVLNCVDVLAGEDALVALRKRRMIHRTLETVEKESKTFIEDALKKTKAAEDEAATQLELANANLKKEAETVEARKDVDDRTKEILLKNIQAVAVRRLQVQTANIEDEKRRATQDSAAEREQNIRAIRNRVKTRALILPAPALLLGLIVFAIRRRRENLGANPNRLA